MATRDHTIVTGAALHTVSKQNSGRLPTEQCKRHAKAVVDFYCDMHDCVFCNACKVGFHSKCTNIQKVSVISKGRTYSNVLKTVESEVKQLKTTLEQLLQKEKQKLQTIQQTKKQCLGRHFVFKETVKRVIR